MGLTRNKKLVLATAASFGYIGRYNTQLGYTPFERFFVGGDGLTGYSISGRELVRLRGYENYQAVTPDIRDVSNNVIEEGALLYDKFSLELRYPITTNPAATIFALAYMEGGNAWIRSKNFNPFEVKRSAGLGVRIFLPMFGLLGFDVGYGFDPPIGSTEPVRTPQFQFYIGQGLF
jgi:outer membrane protein insertion porin family